MTKTQHRALVVRKCTAVDKMGNEFNNFTSKQVKKQILYDTGAFISSPGGVMFIKHLAVMLVCCNLATY